MTFDEFLDEYKDELDELFRPRPALISYEMDDKGQIKSKMQGRNFDIQFLVAMMARDTAKKCNIPIEDYFDMLKEFSIIVDKRENKDVVFNKMFKDLF